MTTRINVYSTSVDEYGEGSSEFAGWFDSETAERFDEDTYWNGNNHISVNTRSQWDHQAIYRTAGGRWVFGTWSNRQGSPKAYEFMTDDQARQWLLINAHDEAVERHFGQIPSESGPSTGRPEIGAPVQVRLPEELRVGLDAVAAERGVPRAEVIRQLLAASLSSAMTGAQS